MKHLLPALVALLIAAPNALGIDLFKKDKAAFDYTAWRDTADIVRTADGMPLFYPSTANEEVTVSGEIEIPGQSAEKIFLGALDYATEHLDTTEDHEQIGDYNPAEKSFMLRLFSRQGSNNNETTYTRFMLVKALNGKLQFKVMQPEVRYREKGVIPRTLPFERLNPATNSRHFELIEQFAAINSQYLHKMAESIADSRAPSVTHWDEIIEKKVTKGMNTFEVRLILGKPVTERENGERLRWVYPKNYVLLFVDGKLSRIVD